MYQVAFHSFENAENSVLGRKIGSAPFSMATVPAD